MTSQITTPEAYFNQLVSDLCIEISFRAFQKQMTINSVCPHCNQQCENIHERAGLDIYGNRIDSNGGVLSQGGSSTLSSNAGTIESSSQPSSNNGMLTVECPCCKKMLAATRFAPHLEKCMGMGRQSARKRGNLMMKMAAGSENESDDASEIVTKTPALPTNEENFSQTSSAAKSVGNTNANEAKKVKVSPSKAKSATPGSNSKPTSPSKNNKKTSATPSKGKSVNTKK